MPGAAPPPLRMARGHPLRPQAKRPCARYFPRFAYSALFVASHASMVPVS